MKVVATFVGALIAVSGLSQAQGLIRRDGVSEEVHCPGGSAAGELKFIECNRGCATNALNISGPHACSETYYGCARRDGGCDRAAEYMKRFVQATDPALDSADITSRCDVCIPWDL